MLHARATNLGMPDREQGSTNAESLGLDHLRAFLAVVETGSQVRAAKRLRSRQTTISRHIKRVQEHFGGALFDAGASGRLTTRGQIVEQSVRAAIAELSHARDRLARERPLLRIGYIRPMQSLLQVALRNQGKVHDIPSFDVRLLELTGELQARALERRELDIAVSYALPDFANRSDIEQSLVTEEPFALVIPERAYVRGKPVLESLASLTYAHSPRRFSEQLALAGERWLRSHRLAPKRTIECELGSEIIAYAGAGHGYGFLPALWSMASHDGVVFAAVKDFGATARIAAYSLQHVTPWVVRLREDLSAAARAALRDFRAR